MFLQSGIHFAWCLFPRATKKRELLDAIEVEILFFVELNYSLITVVAKFN